MRLADLTHSAGEWLRGGGPMHDVVISSRVRLARNLAGMPFLTQCSEEQQGELANRLRQEILAAEISRQVLYVDIAGASELDRQLLVERHLISRQLAEASHPRGVAISGDETSAIMVNEEDHLRIQVLRGGLDLRSAVDDISRMDDLLEARLDYAFHGRYGYLTACPTNVGTGLRVSVMLHLPVLKMTGEIEKAFRAASDMRLAIRGLFGEGTEASGDFFQVSNQTTLGKTEEQIVDEFLGEMVPQFVEYEQRAEVADQAAGRRHRRQGPAVTGAAAIHPPDKLRRDDVPAVAGPAGREPQEDRRRRAQDHQRAVPVDPAGPPSENTRR